MQSFTARMPLLTAASAFGLGRRRWSYQLYRPNLSVNVYIGQLLMLETVVVSWMPYSPHLSSLQSFISWASLQDLQYLEADFSVSVWLL